MSCYRYRHPPALGYRKSSGAWSTLWNVAPEPIPETDPADDSQRRLVGLCARTCRWSHCTGKGATVRWAHVCRMAPAVVTGLSCGVPGCGVAPARPYPHGPRCDDHGPTQPSPTPSAVPSPSRLLAAPVYGEATTDPLGRTVIDARTRLPRRAEA